MAENFSAVVFFTKKKMCVVGTDLFLQRKKCALWELQSQASQAYLKQEALFYP